MKNLSIIAASFLFLTVSAQASTATYKCTEQEPANPKAAVSVSITELADITKEVSFGKEYDYVMKVKVDIFKGAQKLKSFDAVSTDSDVIYGVHAVKKEGVFIRIYQDELDQSYMTVTKSNGEKVDISLACE